ncbi:hypothetical protein OESDEN_20749 [Oesophagostomum dentatum]|uniref:Uncharacterized protein n=1 Tax=Oesophagostomum dentatum TaxID=61180 RepID=A0A0B1S3V3_OESDE|nr:hypothetical protein OESDEN_20749 [Oesophagostomum dentatum]
MTINYSATSRPIQKQLHVNWQGCYTWLLSTHHRNLNRKELLGDLIVGDESWILFDNNARHAVHLPRDAKTPTQPKPDLHSRKHLLSRLILMLNFSAVALIFNTYLLNKNMWLITAYKERFGLMHASTVSCIITGIKPMINIFIIGLFAIRVRQHLHLIKVRSLLLCSISKWVSLIALHFAYFYFAT